MNIINEVVTLAAVAVMSFSATAHAEQFHGPFVGVDLGYDHYVVQYTVGYDYKYSNDSTYTSGEKFDGRSANGLAGGVFVGYDTKLNTKLFAGVELRAGLSVAKYSESNFWNENYYDESYSGSYKDTLRAKQSLSATARLGYLLNEKTGVYVRGGVVETRFKVSGDGYNSGYTSSNSGKTLSVKDSNTVWLYGAGLQTSVTAKTSLRVEYNVTQYGGIFNKLNKQNFSDYYASKENLANHQVRIGLSYGF